MAEKQPYRWVFIDEDGEIAYGTNDEELANRFDEDGDNSVLLMVDTASLKEATAEALGLVEDDD